MEAFFFKSIPGKPQAGHTITVRLAGTLDLYPGQLVDLSGANLTNPFLVVDANEWGFVPPSGALYDVYWAEGGITLAKGQGGAAGTYTHPVNHAPSIITQDANNRFVTDTEKGEWNAKEAGGAVATHAAIEQAHPRDTRNQVAGAYEATGVAAGLVDEVYATLTDWKDPTGFVDNSGITVSYNKVNRTVTLAGDLSYRWRGIDKALVSPWTSPAHNIGDGLFFLMSSNGTDFVWSSTPWAFDYMMASAVWVIGADAFALREPHGLMGHETHEELHQLLGTYRASGLGPTAGSYTLATATDAATTPGFDAGIIKDEDIRTVIAATVDGSYTTMRVGAGGVSVFDTAATFPFRSAGSFLLVNDPATGAETAAVNNRYLNVYELLIPAAADADSQKYRRLLVQPQKQFTSLAAAQAEDFTSVSLGNLGSPEYVAYSRLTYLTASGNANTGKVTLAGISYLVGSRANQAAVLISASQTAENVPFTPAGGVEAVNVQAAIEELDSEKLDISAIDDTPVDAETAAPISSNWAFDHAAEVTTKHLPSQAAASGLFLTSNGTEASWAAVTGGAIDWLNPVAVTTTATLTIGKHHVCTGTTADYTVTLPAVAGNAGKLISVEMAAALTKLVTLDGNASETIDGELTRVMWAKETAILSCNGTTWTKVAGKSIPMMFAAFSTADQTGLTSGTAVKCALSTEGYDIGGVFDNASTYSLITRRKGKWQMSFAARVVPTTSNRLIGCQSYLRNATRLYSLAQEFYFNDNTQSGIMCTMSGGSTVDLTAGDDLYLVAYGATGTSTFIIRGTGTASPLYYGGVFLTGIEVMTW